MLFFKIKLQSNVVFSISYDIFILISSGLALRGLYYHLGIKMTSSVSEWKETNLIFKKFYTGDCVPALSSHTCRPVPSGECPHLPELRRAQLPGLGGETPGALRPRREGAAKTALADRCHRPPWGLNKAKSSRGGDFSLLFKQRFS